MTYYKLLKLKHLYYIITTSLIWRRDHPIGRITEEKFPIVLTSEEECMLDLVKAIKDYESLVNNNTFILKLCSMLDGLIKKDYMAVYSPYKDLEHAKRIINEVHKHTGFIPESV